MPRRRGTVGLGREPREMKVFQSFRGDKGQRKGKKEEEKRACRRIPRCGLFHHPREEEKRREVVTGNVYSAYTQAPRRTPRLWHTVDISKYLLSAAGLSLSLSPSRLTLARPLHEFLFSPPSRSITPVFFLSPV